MRAWLWCRFSFLSFHFSPFKNLVHWERSAVLIRIIFVIHEYAEVVRRSGAYSRGTRVNVSKVHLQVDNGVGVYWGRLLGLKCPFLGGQHIPPGRLSSPSEPSIMIKEHEWQPCSRYQTPPCSAFPESQGVCPVSVPVWNGELNVCRCVRDEWSESGRRRSRGKESCVHSSV